MDGVDAGPVGRGLIDRPTADRNAPVTCTFVEGSSSARRADRPPLDAKDDALAITRRVGVAADECRAVHVAVAGLNEGRRNPTVGTAGEGMQHRERARRA